jgi:hypothetical protein
MYGAPNVIATMCGETGQSFPDVHAIVVHDVDVYGFNATVLRVDDLGHGWMSNVRAHWLAWLPRLRLAPTPVRAPVEEQASSRNEKGSRNPRPEPQKVATLPENGGGGGDPPHVRVPTATASTISDTDNATEHVHTRSSLQAPSQSINVFAESANGSVAAKSSGAVVHATVAPKSEQIIDFDHLPELPDPTEKTVQGEGAQLPEFVKEGETDSTDGRKWDFVAIKPKGITHDQPEKQSHDSGRRRTLLYVDD